MILRILQRIGAGFREGVDVKQIRVEGIERFCHLLDPFAGKLKTGGIPVFLTGTEQHLPLHFRMMTVQLRRDDEHIVTDVIQSFCQNLYKIGGDTVRQQIRIGNQCEFHDLPPASVCYPQYYSIIFNQTAF